MNANPKEKTTGDLMKEVLSANNIDEYLKRNKREMQETSLPGLLMEACQTKGLTRAEAIRRSGFDETYGFQIFSGLRRPSRDRMLCLTIGMGLTVEEIQALLKRSNFSLLYPRRARDSVILFCIQAGRTPQQINQKLIEEKLTPIL